MSENNFCCLIALNEQLTKLELFSVPQKPFGYTKNIRLGAKSNVSSF